MPQILISTSEVALQLEFQFAPGTTRKFQSLHLCHCLQTVSLLAGSVYSWNRCPPRPCPHWGQKSQGHATLNKGTHLTAISTRSNFKYIVDQHKSVSRVDRAQMKIPLPPFNKKKKQERKIYHTHTHKLRCCPLKQTKQQSMSVT